MATAEALTENYTQAYLPPSQNFEPNTLEPGPGVSLPQGYWDQFAEARKEKLARMDVARTRFLAYSTRGSARGRIIFEANQLHGMKAVTLTFNENTVVNGVRRASVTGNCLGVTDKQLEFSNSSVLNNILVLGEHSILDIASFQIEGETVLHVPPAPE